MNTYAPCPQCKSSNAEKVRFTWWGGLIGPRLLSHVKCLSCGKGYNGKSGKDNTTGIAIYMVIIGVVVFGFVAVLLVALGILAAIAK